MIPRFQIDRLDGFNNHPTGNVVLVDDIATILKEMRSEYLSDDTDERRLVVEKLMRELNINVHS